MDFSQILVLGQSLSTPLGSIIGAIILLVIGFIIAKFIRSATKTALSKTGLDSKLSSTANLKPLSGTIADIVYWFVILIVLTMVSGNLGLTGIFSPLTNMIDKIFNFIPNAIMAGLIFFIGFVIAKIVKGIAVSVINGLNVQKIANSAGVSTANSLPNIAGSVAFLVVIIPFTIAALDALKVETISRPATNMLNKILEALPNIFVAIAILVVTYYVMKMVANVIKELVASTQLNALPAKLGIQASLGNYQVSDLLAHGLVFFAMLFASIASADLLGFAQISEIITMFIEFGGQIVLGAVILVIGFWLANIVATTVANSSQGSKFLANIVRVLITGLVLAMGLKAMGIADSIVNLAFGLTLGSVAVAFALSFGLGGREAAARYLARLQDKLEKPEENTPSVYPESKEYSEPKDF